MTLYTFLRFSVKTYWLSSGTDIPAGIKSPAGNGDGEEMFPVNVHGDGDGGLSRDVEFSIAILNLHHLYSCNLLFCAL